MNTEFTKEDFNALDFDTKCIVMEQFLTDDFFRGQTDISFTVNDIDEKTGNLVPLPPEVEAREDELFNQLIIRLTDKLYQDKTTIEFDLDKIFED
jgi:hypothetical protein